MRTKEAYELLELQEDATEAEIKKAFRTKAAKLHPDQNKDDPQAEEKFKQVNQAYQILTGAAQPESEHLPFGARGNPFGPFGINIDFMQDLRDFFGGGGPSQNANVERKTILQIDAEIPFKMAVLGGEEEITFQRKKVCITCNGSGKLGICDVCHGQGNVIESAQAVGMFTQTVRPCPKCRGVGGKERCGTCQGTGHTKENAKIKAKIPPVGNKKDLVLRVPDLGHEYITRNGTRRLADIHITLHPQTKHNKFSINKDRNVILYQSLPLTTILFGGTIEVETVAGEKKTLEIKPNSKAGDSLIIKGEGVRGYNNVPGGDQIVYLEIEYPKKLTEELKQALINSY